MCPAVSEGGESRRMQHRRLIASLRGLWGSCSLVRHLCLIMSMGDPAMSFCFRLEL